MRSLKSVCDRLDRFYRFKGQRWADQLTPSASGPCTAAAGPGHYLYASFHGPSPGGVGQARFGSIGPNDPEKLRKAKKAKLTRVRGKNKSEREVFLSVDARDALADYIEKERPFRPAGLIEFPPPPDVRKAVWSIVDQGKIGEDRAICPRNEK